MLKNKVGIAVICIVILLVASFLYWRTFDSTNTILVTNVSQRAPTQSPEMPIAAPHPDIEATVKTPAAPKEETDTISETPEDTEEVRQAIDFLETLEEQSQSENNGEETGQQATGNTSELTQDEMLQIVREGVSYYDSLVESGSIEFMVESSSIDFPGTPRGPNGTRYGTFEFSNNDFKSTITEDMTYYNGGETGNAPHTSQSTTEFAYDGETFEILREDNNGFRLERRTDVAYPSVDDPRFWGWNLTGTTESLVDVIDSFNIENIQIDESSSQNYYITGTVADGTAELWVNPEKSYRPERFTFQGPMGSIIKEYDFQEIAPDLWFPVSASSVITAIDSTTGVETDILTQSISMTNVRLNEHIPSYHFTIEPPPGARVYDRRTRESFIVPEENN
ncbi:MAG: hypothetical protein OXH39_08780 [Candidatus Poribacteria bacterium]|nr:hypothetical protein [Candidatus Poribacteria bacterium]